jgi:undecaprenyl-diphosphatase
VRALVAPVLLLLAVATIGVWVRHDPLPALDVGIEARVDAAGLPQGLLRAISAPLNQPFGWVASLLLAALVARRRSARAGLVVVLAFAATVGLYTFAKEVFDRARPLEAAGAGGTSYPSGHVASATILVAATAAAFLEGAPRGARVLGALAAVGAGLLMGLSRVGLHRHHPTDVLGGILLAFAVLGALCAALGAGRTGPAGAPPPQDPGGLSQTTAPPGRK